jgi:GST-like protein
MTETTGYTPPRVWTWDKPSGGYFASINRPTAGATFEAELPVGKHPLQLYSMATPNGVKVALMLEELLQAGHDGAGYDAWLIDINKGAQFSSGFVGINPNSKIPALVDRSTKTPTRVFESGSILLYLAEKFGAFLPAAARTEALSWLFWQVGSAPSWVGASVTFTPTHRTRWSTPSTATRWRRSGCSMCSTGASRRAHISPGACIPLPTSQPGPGTAR